MSSESLFDRSARNFAASIDAVIAMGGYTRGKVFVRAVKQSVARGGTILDYGCGPGRLARLIAQDGYHVHGLDPSAGMLAEANQLKTDGLEMIFEQLYDNGESLATSKYDGIVCSSTIEYVTDPAALLRQFHRALRPGGSLVISYSNRVSLWRKYSEVRGRNTAPHLKLQFNIWRFGEFKTILEKNGFKVESRPVFFDVAPFDKRSWLRPLSSWPVWGTLGLVVARRAPEKLE